VRSRTRFFPSGSDSDDKNGDGDAAASTLVVFGYSMDDYLGKDELSTIFAVCSRKMLRSACMVSRSWRVAAAAELALLPKPYRMSEQVLPHVDEIVLVEIRRFGAMGARVALLEYGGIEGFLLREGGRRLITPRNAPRLKVGDQLACIVLRVDRDRRYIDLSRKRVSMEEMELCARRYVRSAIVHSLVYQVSRSLRTSMEDVYRRAVWPHGTSSEYAIEIGSSSGGGSGGTTAAAGSPASEKSAGAALTAASRALRDALRAVRDGRSSMTSAVVRACLEHSQERAPSLHDLPHLMGQLEEDLLTAELGGACGRIGCAPRGREIWPMSMSMYM
jgi:hypothetical protein